MDLVNAMPGAEAGESYNSEPLGPNSVRLLTLQPAKNNTCPVVATLEISSFPPRDTYEALSYVWGTSTPHHCVHVSGRSFEIRDNLYSALVQLRKIDQERILWIDAVCINQDDDVEKSRQVAMMGEIFRNAAAVIIWLGSALEDRANALEYLGSLPEMSQDIKLVNETSFPRMQIPNLDTTSVDLVVSKPSSILSAAITAGVSTLFGSNWFTRVWIVQEYTLAKNIQIRYGNQVLEEKKFQKAVEFLMALMKITGLKQEFRNVNNAWNLICHRIEFQLLNDNGIFVKEPKRFFEAAVSDFRDQDCGDDRDRVFGFLALSTNVPNIEPDYRKTTAEVYTEFAIKNLNYSTLFQAGLRRRGPILDPQQPLVLDRNYLPSWCPDLRRHLESWTPVYGNYFATSTSDYGRLGWSRPNAKLAVFTAWGLGFDTIERTEPRNADSHFAPTSNPQSFFTMINYLKTIQKEIMRELFYPTTEMFEMALAITLACGIPALATDIDGHPLMFLIKKHETCRSLFENLWLLYLRHCMDSNGNIHRKMLEIKEETTIPDDFTIKMTGEERLTWIYHEHLTRVIQNHDIFRTKNGYFGLAPPGIKQGDQIAVLSGHRTPFVIRKAPVPSVPVEVCCRLAHTREEGDTVEYYQVLGPCYVHGIMHGELYKDAVWQERFPWSKMEIYPGCYVPLPGSFCHLI